MAVRHFVSRPIAALLAVLLVAASMVGQAAVPVGVAAASHAGHVHVALADAEPGAAEPCHDGKPGEAPGGDGTAPIDCCVSAAFPMLSTPTATEASPGVRRAAATLSLARVPAGYAPAPDLPPPRHAG